MLAPDIAARRNRWRKAGEWAVLLALGAVVGLSFAFLPWVCDDIRARRGVAVATLTVRTVLLLPDSGAWVRIVPEPGRFRIEEPTK